MRYPTKNVKSKSNLFFLKGIPKGFSSLLRRRMPTSRLRRHEAFRLYPLSEGESARCEAAKSSQAQMRQSALAGFASEGGCGRTIWAFALPFVARARCSGNPFSICCAGGMPASRRRRRSARMRCGETPKTAMLHQRNCFTATHIALSF